MAKEYKFIYKGKEHGYSYNPNWVTLIRDLYYGLIIYKYPFCCVMQFCNETIYYIPSAIKRCDTFNIDFDNDNLHPTKEYVPCDKCMKNLWKHEYNIIKKED